MTRVSLLWATIAFAGLSSAADCTAETRELSTNFLLGDEPAPAPVAMQEFRRDTAAATPPFLFSGKLSFDPAHAKSGFVVHHDPFGLAGNGDAAVRRLPSFDINLVQRGDDVVPLQRGVMRTRHPNWEIAVQPGLVWQDDAGWARISLPFALQERSANCTHNGVMTWLLSAGGEISRVYYQVSSETCAYFKFDMWGFVDATYTPQDFANQAATAIARLDEHRAARLPVQPLTALADKYPDAGIAGMGVTDGIPAQETTALGMIVDGIHYRGECMTRHGPYPYCDSIPLPSYSTAKSIFAAVATMRLEKLYPGASQKSIASLIDECDSKRWRNVTVENALDMATGNYRSAEFDADEAAPRSVEFLDSASHEQKIGYACKYFKRKSPPGTRFVYHTSDTYLVGEALSAIVAKVSDGADLYQSILVQPLWRALRLSPLLDSTKRTYDEHNVAFAGYGLTFEPDDIARLAQWLAHDNGVIDRKAMLDRGMLDAALQRTTDDRGLETGLPQVKYNNGFWAIDAGQSIGCERSVWIPFMSGYGGITVAMLPNGIVYYYFSDTYVYKWTSAITAANSIASMCPT